MTELVKTAGPRLVLPEVISVSRRCDIPAFEAEWFADAWEKGGCIWQNPFNSNQRQRVGFSDVQAVVFWSKHPEAVLRTAQRIRDEGVGIGLLYTLNDYEREGFEPGVPPLKTRLKTFRRWSRAFGSGATAWRFDPIVLTDRLGVEDVLCRVEALAKRLEGFTTRLIFSFVDLKYRGAARRMEASGENAMEPGSAECALLCAGLVAIGRRHGMRVSACCEPCAQVAGIEREGCISARWLLDVCGDRPLIAALERNPKRDRGQRSGCECVASKDIGRYGQCGFECTYCYANR